MFSPVDGRCPAQPCRCPLCAAHLLRSVPGMTSGERTRARETTGCARACAQSAGDAHRCVCGSRGVRALLATRGSRATGVWGQACGDSSEAAMRREGVQARRHTNGCRCCGPARTKHRGLCWRARRCGRARLSVSAPSEHGGGGSGPRGVHEKKEMHSRSGVLPRAAVKVLWNEASGPTVHVREVAGRQDGCRGAADASRLCFVARGKLWRSGKHFSKIAPF